MTADERTAGMPSPSQTLVLYDGVCGMCNRLVAFLLRHDRNDRFRFAPLQSPAAQTLFWRYGLDPKDFDTVVVIADFGQASERALTRSAAALLSLDQVGGVWRLAGLGKLIPLALREALYKFIARHRYRVFGKYDVCPLPKPEDRAKFLLDS
jgi:predicted DCC family thiol-disulfide oxidoreductase YuxK